MLTSTHSDSLSAFVVAERAGQCQNSIVATQLCLWKAEFAVDSFKECGSVVPYMTCQILYMWEK